MLPPITKLLPKNRPHPDNEFRQEDQCRTKDRFCLRIDTALRIKFEKSSIFFSPHSNSLNEHLLDTHQNTSYNKRYFHNRDRKLP